jgi:two-component system chemotaxis response regulator CheY
VLVVEDDDSTRRAVEQAVAGFGYRCRSARDGLEAWNMHSAEHADVIISDWQMPEMDGIELCRRTRVADDASAYTYFILMTGFADREHFLRGMEAGADDYQTKPVDLDELRARLVSASRVVALCRKLEEKNTALRRDSHASFQAARLDALTGIANRLAMNEDLKVLWSRVKRYDHKYSIAICDIDRFKAYNDHYGHLAGDEALHRVAQAIKEQLREGDGLYRYGGEEFVVVFPDQSLAQATHAVARVCQAVERLCIPATTPAGVVTISAGVAEIDTSRDGGVDDSLRRADAELYRAKARAHARGGVAAGAPPKA